MSCRKVVILISALLVLLAVCFAAPADKEAAIAAEAKDGPVEDTEDLKPAASHYGGWGGHYGGHSPYWGGYWGWPSYGYGGYGYGHGYGYGYPYSYYGNHGYWL